MRKKPVIMKLALVGALVASFVIVTSYNPRITEPSVSFVGYTNDTSGNRRAVFTITNRATQALDLMLAKHCSIEARYPMAHTTSTRSTVAGMEPLGPGDAITASVHRPDAADSWRASFTFLPARPPIAYRMKMWLHRAGVRSMDMSLPLVEAYSDLIE